MGGMDLEAFRRDCAEPKPVYYLLGDQAYLRKKTFEAALEQVARGARTFDWRVYDLEKDSEAALVEECRTPPWMSPRRWLWVHNARLGGKDLLEYLGRPSPRTVLVLELEKKPAGWPAQPVVEMPSRTNAVAWVRQRAEAEGYRIDVAAARTMVELAGEDLQRLESELEKLFLLRLDQRRIDRDSVLGMVFPARDFDIFTLIGALAARDSSRALTILGRLFEAGMTPQAVLAMFHWNFRRLAVAREYLERGRPFDEILRKLKIWSYRGKEREVRQLSPRRLRQVLLRLQQTDRLTKTTSLDGRTLIERLVIDTCGTRPV